MKNRDITVISYEGVFSVSAVRYKATTKAIQVTRVKWEEVVMTPYKDLLQDVKLIIIRYTIRRNK